MARFVVGRSLVYSLFPMTEDGGACGDAWLLEGARSLPIAVQAARATCAPLEGNCKLLSV